MVHALMDLEGVSHAQADYARRQATVVFDEALIDVDSLRRALMGKGFVASPGRSLAGPGQTVTPVSGKHGGKAGKDDFICYCFEHTWGDIEADFLKNGRSLIMERIVAEKKRGACQCATRNPTGR